MSNFAVRRRGDEDGIGVWLSAGREQNNLVVRKSRSATGPGCPAERRRMLNMGKPDHDVLAWHATVVGRIIRRRAAGAGARSGTRGGCWTRNVPLTYSAVVYPPDINTFSVDILLQLMAIQDRTNEFRTCVDSIRSRSALPPRTSEAKQRLLQGHAKGTAKTEFSRMASAIGRDISSTTIKLGKLAHRTLFSAALVGR